MLWTHLIFYSHFNILIKVIIKWIKKILIDQSPTLCEKFSQVLKKKENLFEYYYYICFSLVYHLSHSAFFKGLNLLKIANFGRKIIFSSTYVNLYNSGYIDIISLYSRDHQHSTLWIYISTTFIFDFYKSLFSKPFF